MIYRLRDDPDSFALLVLATAKDGRLLFRDTSALELLRRLCEGWQQLTEDERLFYLVCLVLIEGEYGQRRTVERLSKPRTRNIRIGGKTCCGHIHSLKLLLKYAERKDLDMELEQLKTLLSTSLDAIRQEMKLTPDRPLEVRYHLTEQMYAGFGDEAFKQLIERYIASVGIPTENRDGTLLYSDDLERLEGQVNEYAEPWKKLKEAILATESREHLTALSLTTGKAPGAAYISMANVHGHLLTLEAAKFVALLENPEKPRKLADLVELKRQEPDSLFAFNLHREGEIFAKLEVATSTLQVICRSTKDGQIAGRANFILDIDYSLCLYIALKRLKEDRNRFIELKEGVDNIVNHEVFEQLFTE